MRRRNVLHLLATSAVLLRIGAARGQAFPVKPIRLVVGYQAGGQADLIGRLAAKKVGELLGGNVVVENRPGANGMIAAEQVARAPADGHTLLVGGAANLTIAPAVETEIRYDTLRDFAPVGRIARVPMLIVVRAGLSFRTARELIDFARKNPGKLTFGSPAAHPQLAINALQAAEGIEFVVVPYKGSAPVNLDLIAGRLDFAFSDVGSITPHVASGTVRVVAHAGAARSSAFATVPTMIEQGVAGFDWDTWQSIVAPSATPANTLARLRTAVKQMLEAPDFREGLERLGYIPFDEDPEQFTLALKKELERNRELARRIGRSG